MATPDDFEEFVAARYAALLRTAYLLTGHRADAEDLLQTTLARCVPAWHRIGGDPEPYVRKALVRENVTRWRRRRWREVPTELPPEGLGAGADDPSVPDRLALMDALARLPPRQRAAVVLRHVQGFSEREAAAALGCSVGTVKSQTHAGLRRMREHLGDVDGAENFSPDGPLRTGPSGRVDV